MDVHVPVQRRAFGLSPERNTCRCRHRAFKRVRARSPRVRSDRFELLVRQLALPAALGAHPHLSHERWGFVLNPAKISGWHPPPIRNNEKPTF